MMHRAMAPTRVVGKVRRQSSAPSLIAGLPGLPRAVLTAPLTACTSSGFPSPMPRVVRYLFKHACGKPWYARLSLLALILAAQRLDGASVYAAVSVFNNRLQTIFASRHPKLRLRSMEDFDKKIDVVMTLLANGEIVNGSVANRRDFLTRYASQVKKQGEWMKRISKDQRKKYGKYIFPKFVLKLAETELGKSSTTEEQRRKRKEEVDALMPSYAMLRSEGHMRWNFFCRLREAVHQAMQRRPVALPKGSFLRFSYVEHDLRITMRIWRAEDLLGRLKEAMRGKDSYQVTIREEHILEIESITDVTNGEAKSIEEKLWFCDAIANSYFLKDSYGGKLAKSNFEARDEWRRVWGYPRTPFQVASGLLIYSPNRGLHARLRAYLGMYTIDVEAVFFALTFGLLALDFFTSTGGRNSEALQICLTPQCLVRLVEPAPLGASDQKPSIRYSLRLIPKGFDVAEDYFIGEETKRLIARTARIVVDHYHGAKGGPLPIVPFSGMHPRRYKYSPQPYLFQIGGRHLSVSDINACIRFLLHGVPLKKMDGDVVSLRAHLLRHGFATHALQVEKLSRDIVGAMLHQRDLDVTTYYGRPTRRMIVDAADAYLLKIAANIDVADAILRTPGEIQDMYATARERTGTLAHVCGGACTLHGVCPVQFRCIGCAAKAPDPAQRQEVVHRIEFAEKEKDWHKKNGLLPEVRQLEDLISKGRIELKEMDLIEQYHADAAKQPAIESIGIVHETPLAEEHPPKTPRPNGPFDRAGGSRARERR